ncbi:transcriptional regulator, TetR family [Nocardia amikacinitolerans]|uniref:Transcriptional regulator, TetR family n=2 Tax=Nocardia amikacinitolerans TaxID=756689 RepID=A0A285M061_9NOCA|nr:TetR/AcrR family transcriptional regulator [Nocardia amikacinitolerans]MCP2299315.1 transcriptional regulator, TetR family [Nocardia amikacinitolerans]MCP2319841.1 transcriptional regulator, TetR family [Nocardia amikacinitolerans]SNY89777.1 transcriptional regulator, TetR family [Nocardia amikacinitolerans]
MTATHRRFPATLWERRKVEAMSRIQRVALDLFDEYGYREVTVERVAAEAGVSPSSIYRYFGTKEMLVLYDEADPHLLEVLRTAGDGETLDPAALLAVARPLVPVMIAALITPDSEHRIARRLRYVRAFPEVRDGQTRQMRELEKQFGQLFAERCGRDPNDLKVRMAASTAIWGGVAALDHWAGRDFAEPLSEVYTEAVGSIIDALELIVR